MVMTVRTYVALTVCVTKSQDPVQTVLQVGMDQGVSLSAVLNVWQETVTGMGVV